MHYATDAVQDMLQDHSYWTDLEAMDGRTKYFKESLLLFQNDGKRANLADVFERYSMLCEKYENEGAILAVINKTWDDLSSDMHASCMLLDWRKHGSRFMTDDDRKDGMEGIKQYFKNHCKDANGKLFQKFEECYLLYEAKSDIFESEMFNKMNENTSLITILNTYRALGFRYQCNFWGLFFVVAEDICKKRMTYFLFLFLFLFVIVIMIACVWFCFCFCFVLFMFFIGPSNDIAESTFNNIKWIHNKWRNSLGKEKIKKLVKAKFNGDIIERDPRLFAQTVHTDDIDYGRAPSLFTYNVTMLNKRKR